MRTIAIDDPGPLLEVLPEPGISWVRREEGMVAWGEVARIDATGPTRIDSATAWWRQLVRHAQVRDEVRSRGTGLVAFGSFSFADESHRRRHARGAAVRGRLSPRAPIGSRSSAKTRLTNCPAWPTLGSCTPRPHLSARFQ